MKKIPEVQSNFIDKAITLIDPVRAAKRYRARLAMAIASSYTGADKTRRSLKEWTPASQDADTDILYDLPELRSRSRDLTRNNPLASGVIKTKVTNVVGSGVRLQSHIDREVIGFTEEQSDAWERATEREWRLFWESKDCDAARTCNGHALTRQVYQQCKENGDVLVLLPMIKRKNFPSDIKLQVVEADRLCNPDGAMDDEKIAGGIEKDLYGAPIAYHISKYHPGSAIHGLKQEWVRVPAFGKKTGLRNVIHLYSQTRPGQSRGVPDLAAVIEPLKQLGRYTEAEIMAAVVSGMFTVFIKSEGGIGEVGLDYTKLSGETGQKSTDKDLKLGNGLIMELNRGEDVVSTNPGRPNQAFDPFMMAIFKQIGMALEIPFEILIKHFSSSYSAARASINEFWKWVTSERRWLYDNFLEIAYERWMWEAVADGRIAAPGFFADPILRKAYLGCDFIGPAKGQINEKVEAEAAVSRINAGLSNRQRETAELTGGDWERTHDQLVKENKRRANDGLIQKQQGEDPNGTA